jgi:hypothetical protein
VFENRVLRRIFGLKRDEETGGWRNLHNGELHNLCPLSSMIRTIQSYSTNGGVEECIYDIGGKARRKETTRKTKSCVGG